MKSSRWHAIIHAALLVIFTNICIAETLENAWTIALENDQSLQAVRTQTSAAEADFKSAKSNRLPVFKVGSVFTQLDDTATIDIGQLGVSLPFTLPNAFSNDNYVVADARVTMPVYTSGLISNGINAANAALGLNKSREVTFVEDLKLAVAESFVAVLRAQRSLSVTQTNVTSLRAHAKDVASLYKNGVAPQNDLLAVEVSLANARQFELQAANGLNIAKAAYNRRLGRNMDLPVTLDEVMPSVAKEAMQLNLKTLTDGALSRRSELDTLSKQATALRYKAEATRAKTKPQIAVNAGYTYFENDVLDDDTFASVGISVSWALFDGGQSSHRADALSLQARSVSEQRNDFASLISLQVRSAWLNIEESRQRMEVTQKAIAQAEENLRVAKNRYQNGIGTNTEVLDAETLRTATLSNHNNARYDAALARLRLARVIGVL